MGTGFRDATSCWKEILSDVSHRRDLLSEIERFARDNTTPATIVFGTSGWRGEIGTDFTFNNVRIVTEAIIYLFKEQETDFMKAMGVRDFDDIKERGVIVGHDNRFLGRELAMEVIGRLKREGIKTWYAGEATTPEFSAGIEMLNASCSINLTPSHNPANYGGFKFNPSDGGPAGPEITSRIQEVANAMMKEAGVLEPLLPDEVEDIDLTSLYIDYLKKKGTIDLNKIRDFINKADCLICIDNVHGATRGRIQRILGESDRIVYLRTDDDPLFGGVAPEPSEKNMQGVMDVLGRSTSRFKLGVIMDPDGDRIRHADGERIIFMNYFGAMAFHYLHTYKGFKGVVVKSVGTSEFVDAIASAHGVPVRETKVGFKNFRPFMVKDAKERAIVCFEESDGISGYNHTLEKDALFGTLLAIEMMATTGKNLSEYLDDLMNTYGHYYPDRSGIEVDRPMSGEPLKHRISTLAEKYTPGTILHTGATTYTVKEIITKDGVKMVFDNGAWIMIRPSGTEPKVRFYIDARSEDEKAILFETAERITREALGIS